MLPWHPKEGGGLEEVRGWRAGQRPLTTNVGRGLTNVGRGLVENPALELNKTIYYNSVDLDIRSLKLELNR
jgi:hypothetical protein